MRDCSHARRTRKSTEFKARTGLLGDMHKRQLLIPYTQVRKQIYSKLMPLTALNSDDSRNRSW